MGGAMHDAAISAWGSKGYYDYARPISVIRYLYENRINPIASCLLFTRFLSKSNLSILILFIF